MRILVYHHISLTRPADLPRPRVIDEPGRRAAQLELAGARLIGPVSQCPHRRQGGVDRGFASVEERDESDYADDVQDQHRDAADPEPCAFLRRAQEQPAR